jgi:hypothetical protein
VCSLAVVLGLGCGPRVLDAVPSHLVGRWKTDAPRYAERWLEIRPDALAFGMGRVPLDVHPIERIEIEPEPGGGATFRLHYTEVEGFPDALVVHYRGTPVASLTLGAREERWTRAGR